MKPQQPRPRSRVGRIFCCFATIGLVCVAGAMLVGNMHHERAFGQSRARTRSAAQARQRATRRPRTRLATSAAAAPDKAKKPAPRKPLLLPKRRLPKGQQPLTLQFKIEGGDKSPGFSIACSGGEFQYLRDRGNADQTNVTSIQGNVELLGSGKVSVSFEFRVQENNEQKNVENTIQIKGNTVLKIGGKTKLAQIGNEGSLLLTIVKSE